VAELDREDHREIPVRTEKCEVQSHEAPQRGDRAVRALLHDPARLDDEPPHRTVEDGDEHVLLVLEGEVDGAVGDAGPPSDVGHGGPVVAAARDLHHRRVEDPLALRFPRVFAHKDTGIRTE